MGKKYLEAKLIASVQLSRLQDVPPPVTMGKSNVLVQHVLVMMCMHGLAVL
jgi:hypothetical protein